MHKVRALKKEIIHDMILEMKGGCLGVVNETDIEHEEELQAIAKLRLLDDDLMTLVFDRNIEATELLLNIILQRNDLKVLEVVAQREYKNPVTGGRSITLDIYAEDKDGKIFDIEVQRAPAGADVHRARFHSSMIDTKMLKEKQRFKEIHDSWVIFITESDVMGAGYSLYHVDRMVKETGVYFGDGSHIIYVNGSYKNDNDPVGKLMHDFRCLNSVDMFYPELAKQVNYFKESEGGRKIMCEIFEELAEKRAIERVEKVREQVRKEVRKEVQEEIRKEVRKEVQEEVREETRVEILFNSIKSLMVSMKWTAEQAMEAMKVSENDQKLLKMKF